MRRQLYIFIALMAAFIHTAAAEENVFRCGTWVDIVAIPYEGFHFVGWADGSTDSVLHVEVQSDASYIAYFASNCLDYTNWPLVSLYDWLLLLDVRQLNDSGFYVNEQDVTWYRVVGDIDDLTDQDAYRDDEEIMKGFFLTIDQSLRGTGDYYALVDVASTSQGLICSDILRTVIAHYSGQDAPQRVALMPTIAPVGAMLKLVGLPQDEPVEMCIYSMSGSMLHYEQLSGSDTFHFRADEEPGCYMVHVRSKSVNESLKYIVTER